MPPTPTAAIWPRLEVHTRTERTASTGDHDGAYLVIIASPVERMDQLTGHLDGERVELLRPIEG